MPPKEVLPSADGAKSLTRLELAEVPERPGIYAAWVLDPAALRQCGVAGPVPRLFYVGIATETTLRWRIGQHLEKPWYDLAELLAVQGEALFPWGQRTLFSRPRRGRYRPSPLVQLSEVRAVDWQRSCLRWKWRVCKPERARALEAEAITHGEPLLNRGKAGPVLPQLRHVGRYARARARWLWHIAWVGVLAEDPTWRLAKSRGEDWWPDNSYRVAGGFPVPVSAAGETPMRVRRPDWPATDRFYAQLCDAAMGAPAAVRHALGQRNRLTADELRTWWAAHWGARFLPDSSADPRAALHDALRASLCMEPADGAPGPRAMPRRALRDQIAEMEWTLNRVRH